MAVCCCVSQVTTKLCRAFLQDVKLTCSGRYKDVMDVCLSFKPVCRVAEDDLQMRIFRAHVTKPVQGNFAVLDFRPKPLSSVGQYSS